MSTECTRLVYIAEDNPDLRLIFSAAFTSPSFRVQAAADGREVLGWIEQTLPDVLILDVNMPHISGLDVLRQIRGNPRTRHITVIVVTGNMQTLTAPEGPLADLFLVKPVDVFQLRTFVERFVSLPN